MFLFIWTCRTSETPPMYLPAGDPANKGVVPITIAITDSFGTSADTMITIEVTNFYLLVIFPFDQKQSPYLMSHRFGQCSS